MTDPTKAKIIELFPEDFSREYTDMAGIKHYKHQRSEDPSISLADILRALNKVDPKNKLHVRTSGNIGVISPVSPMTHVYILWNLRADYDGQTQEVKDFIGKLLGL
jgi:hypothetical protein